MVLLRILVLHSLTQNVRVFAKHLMSKENRNADLLSRLRITRFKELNQDNIKEQPTEIPQVIWPMSKIWMN